VLLHTLNEYAAPVGTVLTLPALWRYRRQFRSGCTVYTQTPYSLALALRETDVFLGGDSEVV